MLNCARYRNKPRRSSSDRDDDDDNDNDDHDDGYGDEDEDERRRRMHELFVTKRYYFWPNFGARPAVSSVRMPSAPRDEASRNED